MRLQFVEAPGAHRPAYLAIVLVGIAGIATASMKAIIVGTYVSEFGLRAGEAGYVLSAAMVAATTGTIVSAFLPSRRMLAAALASIFAGDFATATLASSSTLILCQVIAGMGHGFALAAWRSHSGRREFCARDRAVHPRLSDPLVCLHLLPAEPAAITWISRSIHPVGADRSAGNGGIDVAALTSGPT